MVWFSADWGWGDFYVLPLCLAAWERRQQAAERDKHVFTAEDRSGNTYYYFRSNYYKALASVCKQTIGTEAHIYFILSSLSHLILKSITSQKQRFSNEQIRYVPLLLPCQAWLFKSTSTFCFISPEFWKPLLHLTLRGWEFWTQWLFISHYQQRPLDSRISVISNWGLKGTAVVTSH